MRLTNHGTTTTNVARWILLNEPLPANKPSIGAFLMTETLVCRTVKKGIADAGNSPASTRGMMLSGYKAWSHGSVKSLRVSRMGLWLPFSKWEVSQNLGGRCEESVSSDGRISTQLRGDTREVCWSDGRTHEATPWAFWQTSTSNGEIHPNFVYDRQLIT